MDYTLAEKNILLNITVVDENDCTPVIKMQQAGSVSEASARGPQSQHTAHFWTNLTLMSHFNQCCWVFSRYPGDESDSY